MNEQHNVGCFDHVRVARFMSLAVAMAYALSVILKQDPSEHVFVLMNGIDRDLVETLTSGQNTDNMFNTIVDEREFRNHREPEPLLSQNFETPSMIKTPNNRGLPIRSAQRKGGMEQLHQQTEKSHHLVEVHREIKHPTLGESSASTPGSMILSSASRTPKGPADRSIKPPPPLPTRPGLIPSGKLQVQGYPARNLPVNTRMKQNIEAWEAVSSDIQRALKLHFVNPSQSAISESAQPPRAEVLATKPLSNSIDPVRKADTVFPGELEGGVLSPAAREGASSAAGGRVDLAGLAVLNGIEQEAVKVEQREQKDTLRLSQDSLSSLALLRTESAVQAKLSLLQRSLAANIVRDQTPLLRALRANSATADLLLHRAGPSGTDSGQLAKQASAGGPRTRHLVSRSESVGQRRASSSARVARQGRLVAVGQTQLAAMRREVAAMEQLAAMAAAKSQAAAGQGQRKGLLEAAYRIGCRAYMLHKDC